MFRLNNLAIVMLISTLPLVSQVESAQKEINRIESIIEEFRALVLDKTEVDRLLNPKLHTEEQRIQLSYLDREYDSLEIIYVQSDFTILSPDSMILKTRIKWHAPGMSFSQLSNISFVRIDNEWYFDNFEFLKYSPIPIFALSIFIVIYIISVTIGRLHLNKHAFESSTVQNNWKYYLMLPIIGVVMYFVIKPWQDAEASVNELV